MYLTVAHCGPVHTAVQASSPGLLAAMALALCAALLLTVALAAAREVTRAL